MLPIFPPPLPENDDIVVAEIVPDQPPLGGPVSILTIESFRGVTMEACHDVIALSLRKHYKEYSLHPSLTAIANELAGYLCAFGALPIPPERFPKVRVGSPEEFLKIFGTPCDMYYTSHPSNYITVHAKNVRTDGNFPPAFYEELGEELGHFLRAEIRTEVGLPPRLPEDTRGWVRSELVEEFYGYMGRRLLQEATRKHPLEPILFPSGQCAPFIALPELRTIRAALRGWLTRARWFPSVRCEHRARRKDLLTHARGYHFAQKVDVTQIHDWYAFFALSERDIRRRFFRDNPDYSSL